MKQERSLPKISILTWSFNRQGMFDITIPLWLRQNWPDFEILAGCGPDITVPNDPRVKRIVTPRLKMCESYNMLLKEATGDILLITQADMQVTDPNQLQRMYDIWTPLTMVTEKFFKAGQRDRGMFIQFMMVSKSAVEAVGGWDTDFDWDGVVAFEDSDMVAKLMEHGIHYAHTETPPEIGVYHIDHPRPDYFTDPVTIAKVNKARDIYLSKHKYFPVVIYAKQLFNRNR